MSSKMGSGQKNQSSCVQLQGLTGSQTSAVVNKVIKLIKLWAKDSLK